MDATPAPMVTATAWGSVAGVTDEPTDPDLAPGQHDRETSDDTGPPTVDLGAVERDLAGVEAALERLDQGTYWTDEVTGEPIPDDVLATDPVARRAG